ncbi:MAG: hypothetical protein EA368_02125 [Leptolyngbya sp. DLM2.Bin27]|nr:MAG: hypothetical protein EA368_02125 [Leptolyngbya sp. DLM2.Bin27]
MAVLVTSISLLLSLVFMQQQRLNALQEQRISDQDLVRQSEVVAANLAIAQNMPTLGFNNLIADWFFLRFLQYLGDAEAREKTDYSLSPDFFRVIIPNDPYYRMFYFFMSVSTSTLAAQPEASVELMAQGLSYLGPTTPDDSFYIWRYRGIDELLFLGDGVAAQQSFQTAADWARQSPHPDAEIWGPASQRTADFLAANPDSKTAQINSWANVLVNAFDEGTRQTAIERIEALGGTVTISEDGAVNIQSPAED